MATAMPIPVAVSACPTAARYADFGILGQNFFNGPGHSFSPDAVTDEQFPGMGAPRGV